MRRKRRRAISADFRGCRLPPADDFGIFIVGVFTPMANEDFCPPTGRDAGVCGRFPWSGAEGGGMVAAGDG